MKTKLLLCLCSLLILSGCGKLVKPDEDPYAVLEQAEHGESDTGQGTSPYSTGGSFTAASANILNNSINDNNTAIEAIEAYFTSDILGVAYGGTGSGTAAGARTNLDLYSTTEVDAFLVDKQADLDVPSQAEAEAGTATNERVWTAERVKQAIEALGQSADRLSLPLTTAEPSDEAVGDWFLFDNDTYDPSNVAGTTAYFAECTATGSPGTYAAFMSVDGTILISSIEVTTLEASELNDTSDPHLLTAAELKGAIISNQESVGADEWDFPARSEGWNFIYVIEAAQNITLDPNGTEQWYLNGTQMAAGEAIVNAAPTVGESISCYSTETAVYCESKYTDFAEETP